MPLKLDFKTGDKIIINGTVLENAGPNSKLLVHNQAAILRSKEILSDEDAKTPASRVYFALQCAYIFPNREEEYLDAFGKLLDEYLSAAPSAVDIAEEMRREVKDGNLYKGLKESQKLIEHERHLFDDMQHSLEPAAERAEDAPEEVPEQA